LAQVRAHDLTQDNKRENALQNAIRRAPGAVLLRCRYDVRPIFEGASGADPVWRETLLGIAMPVGADEPRIFELLQPVFDLLSVMDEWTDPAALVGTPKLNELVQDLSVYGLIEVHP
jgi:hypothetical protein